MQSTRPPVPPGQPQIPKRFEKGAFGVIIAGFEKPELYHVQFFEGDEPIMDNYLGFSLVKPEDINEALP